jgi:hypothetical protein
MNELIETILANFRVDGVNIPVAYMFYEGHGEPYITYMQENADGSVSGDDELIGYVDYYDFDVYATGKNGGLYTKIIDELKAILKANDFVWQPSRSSMDMYETDTKYYHKTLNFAFMKEEK